MNTDFFINEIYSELKRDVTDGIYVTNGDESVEHSKIYDYGELAFNYDRIVMLIVNAKLIKMNLLPEMYEIVPKCSIEKGFRWDYFVVIHRLSGLKLMIFCIVNQNNKFEVNLRREYFIGQFANDLEIAAIQNDLPEHSLDCGVDCNQIHHCPRRMLGLPVNMENSIQNETFEWPKVFYLTTSV